MIFLYYSWFKGVNAMKSVVNLKKVRLHILRKLTKVIKANYRRVVSCCIIFCFLAGMSSTQVLAAGVEKTKTNENLLPVADLDAKTQKLLMRSCRLLNQNQPAAWTSAG